ncbi:MAG: sigma-70 family RNA polymerase sigma factor [Sedimentisphaerales bacterium]|nr:sigma-70 family RNA polymerase sigma factor [Sedimentisphaerales bacterium]
MQDHPAFVGPAGEGRDAGPRPRAADAWPESQLIRRARAGEQAAFTELLDRFAGPLLGYLHARTGNRQDAEDICQDTFMKVFRSLHRFDSRQRFSCWLYTIARHEAVNFHRRSRREQALPQRESPQAGPLEQLTRQEQSESLWAEARALPPDWYEALWLRYYQGFSVQQIARIMAKSAIHVRVLLYRARNRLLRRLEGHRVGDETPTPNGGG